MHIYHRILYRILTHLARERTMKREDLILSPENFYFRGPPEDSRKSYLFSISCRGQKYFSKKMGSI